MAGDFHTEGALRRALERWTLRKGFSRRHHEPTRRIGLAEGGVRGHAASSLTVAHAPEEPLSLPVHVLGVGARDARAPIIYYCENVLGQKQVPLKGV